MQFLYQNLIDDGWFGKLYITMEHRGERFFSSKTGWVLRGIYDDTHQAEVARRYIEDTEDIDALLNNKQQ